MNKCFITYIRCDVKTMCHILFVSGSLQWRYIKIAIQEYVIKLDKLKLFQVIVSDEFLKQCETKACLKFKSHVL